MLSRNLKEANSNYVKNSENMRNFALISTKNESIETKVSKRG